MEGERRLRVLHLEDNRNDAELIHSMLEAEGLELQVTLVDTKVEFLEALERGGFDLIFSDYSLPSYDGLSALAAAREACPEVPFLFISGAIGEENAIESLKNGATDYVLKQRIARLAPAVRRALDAARERSAWKQAEERIREQAALLDNARDAILQEDRQHRITYWNHGAERLYGWTSAEALGQDAAQILFAGQPSPLPEARARVRETGEWTGLLTQVTKNGKEVIVQSHWTLIRDAEGGARSVLVINTDLTEVKRLEAQFLRAQRMESIGTLAGGIAHDLNNVLSPIVLGLEILRHKVADEHGQKLLSTLESNAQRGAEMVKQVLTFARGAEGELSLIQLRHLILEMEKIARDTFPKSIQIRTNVAGDLWTILGQATPLHQVLLNLCVNARDAMPQGGVLSLVAENCRLDDQYARMNLDAKPGPYVLLSVSDTGTGIPAGVMDKIFDPFFTTKPPGKGTGLGLSTVASIVKSHGGFLNVYTEPGMGTTFKVYLPAQEKVQAREQKAQGVGPPSGKGELILVVDDEAAIQEITRETLEAYDYRVMTASDGAEALAIYAQQQAGIALVLTDMSMPFMDGPAMIRAMARINPEVKVIAASGLAVEGKVAKTGEAAVKAVLKKPYTAEQLLLAVDEVLSPRSQ